MKFSCSFFCLFLLLCSPAFCQDSVTKHSGEILKGKVIRVTNSEVRFSISDSAFSLTRPEVFLIKYADGEEVVITPKPAGSSAARPAISKKPVISQAQKIYQDSLNIAGRNDAIKYYKGYSGASTATLVTSVISPALGLITAVGTSSTPPKIGSLNYPNEIIFEENAYAKGYRNRAKKIKQQHVWTSFGLGTAVSVILLYMLSPLSKP